MYNKYFRKTTNILTKKNVNNKHFNKKMSTTKPHLVLSIKRVFEGIFNKFIKDVNKSTLKSNLKQLYL